MTNRAISVSAQAGSFRHGPVYRIMVAPHDVCSAEIRPVFDAIAVAVKSAGTRPECLDKQEAMPSTMSGVAARQDCWDNHRGA